MTSIPAPLRRTSLSLLFASALWVQSAQAVELQQGVSGYAGAQDASLYADRPENSNGGFGLLFSGTTVNSVRRALIQFDLTTLPPSGAVDLVELRLVLDRSGLFAGDPDTYTLHRITAPWSAGTTASSDLNVGGLGELAATGDATWDSAMYNVTPWATEGGDYLTSPSASLPIFRWDSVRPENNVYTFSGEGLAEDVAFWIANPSQNYGWILIGSETQARNARRFWASEAPQLQNRPKLTINFNSAVAGWDLYDY